jgi:hypothetical protein
MLLQNEVHINLNFSIIQKVEYYLHDRWMESNKHKLI